MTSKHLIAIFFLLGAVLALAGCNAEQSGANGDTGKGTEKGQWRSLFDGKTLQGWMRSDGSPVTDHWQAIDGELVLTRAGGGDIVTKDRFENFELSLEWKISRQGNSGIFYRVAPGPEAVWQGGIEYQVLDNDDYPGLAKESHTAGSVFDLYAPQLDAAKPAMEFNHARIIVQGDHVEHWLNGKKILEYTLWSEDWMQRINASKFAGSETFAKTRRGHIALQDHGNKVWYRNIKIREL